MSDNLGDRIKSYEQLETQGKFLPNVPLCARIDGRSFHRFTRNAGMKRPFDATFHAVMVDVTIQLVKETHAILGYTQSDEINLAFYHPVPGSSVFFDGKKFKMISSLAAMTSVFFNRQARAYWPSTVDDLCPTFDARVFQLPSLVELANTFLWRQLDCFRNSISMAASHYYSHSELHGKDSNQQQEMLFAKGINFNDYPPAFKGGTFVRKILVKKPIGNVIAIRSDYEEFYLPKISTLDDPVKTLFNELNQSSTDC